MRKYYYWLLPFIWMGIIFIASTQPYEKQNIQPVLTHAVDLSFIKPYIEWISFTYNQSIISVESLGLASFVEFFIRKGAHVFVFFILMILFHIAFSKTTNLSFRLRLLFSFGLSFVYGGIDEFHQGFTANRTSYIGDVFLDGFGALLAAILLLMVHMFKKLQQSR